MNETYNKPKELAEVKEITLDTLCQMLHKKSSIKLILVTSIKDTTNLKFELSHKKLVAWISHVLLAF